MTDFSLFGTKLVWPSSAAGKNFNQRFLIGKNIFGFKSYVTINSYMIVVYGRKPGTQKDKFYLFSYATRPRRAFSPSRPNIIELSAGMKKTSPISSKATISYSTPKLSWKNSGDEVNFNLVISVNIKGEKPQVVTENIIGSIA